MSAALQCPGHNHTFGRHSMDNISSDYLNNAQVIEAIKTKYLAQGHKNVGASGA